MKTRKEAEARSMELFPIDDFPFREDVERQEELRKAFLQCWEEMQANKQTCGFCVEPKNEVKEQLPQRQDSLSEQLRDLRLVANKLGMYDAADYIKETTIQDNGLREAAEKVVLKWIDKCAITAEDIEKLQIALK
jgi:hypothetical protein